MEEKRYRVIFRGELAEGAQIDAVKEKLAAAFKKDLDSIEQLFSGEEKLIKKNAPLDACMKIRTAFQKAGAQCVIEPEGSQEAAEGAGGETPPPLPEREAGAGTKGPGDRFCSHCGAVIHAGTQFCPECGVKKREEVDKIALVLLTFFLGGIGAHKFYLGKYVQGVLYFLFSWTFIPSVIAFVEFLIYAFTSAERLQEKYTAKASVVVVIIAACAGFMVLVAILGIIAAIAIPQFAMYRNRAREAALESELKNLMSAQYAYFEKHNRYASDLADLKFVKSSPDIVLEVVSADRDCFEAKAAFEGHNKEMWADCEGITGAREGTRAAAATGRGSFSSEEGGFSVLFPGTPNENKQSVQTAAGNIELTMFLFEDGTGAYLVGYSDYPDKIIASASSEQLLDNAIRGGMGNTGGILVGQESIAIDGYPGKEISFRVPSSGQMPGGGKGMARYYLMGNRLYQVLIVTGADRDEKDFVRFLDSFRLL